MYDHTLRFLDSKQMPPQKYVKFDFNWSYFLYGVRSVKGLEKGIRYFLKFTINLKLNFIFTQVLQNLQKQIIDRMILSTFSFRILAIKKVLHSEMF